ncbi:CamS family sex pheromone protein [Caldalkalibacillus mannanilyticus]|uniref:CamS family sex pheromone protein n=1 Tax=Caldalkalibacillus mannanilyticus TaxID=1418 RepID=UPI000469611A|nr:CamS family sex pheromone protein [Caldalkalibacillus mannanilyticus]
MNMKKSLKICGIVILTTALTTGCLQKEEAQPPVIQPEGKEEAKIAPSVQVEERYYRGLAPFKPSETRGSLFRADTLQSYRLDADRLELGLLEIAQEFFPIESHLFSEGQFITRDELNSWLRIKSEKHKLGLNPEESEQRILRHILEHNYTNLKGEVEGIVIGLSLASAYQQKKEDGTSLNLLYSDDELRNHGAKMADLVVERVRKKAPDVPITIALYRLEESNSMVPGNFLSVGKAGKNQMSVDSWKTINEVYFLFPSQALHSYDRELSTLFSRYRQDVQEFYPNFVGIIGIGRFIDDKLVEITFNVTTEFSSKTEVIQLTQFLGGSAVDTFPANVHLNIYLQSVNQARSIFVRPAQGESVMHIYR